jgi:hypothetical protein
MGGRQEPFEAATMMAWEVRLLRWKDVSPLSGGPSETTHQGLIFDPLGSWEHILLRANSEESQRHGLGFFFDELLLHATCIRQIFDGERGMYTAYKLFFFALRAIHQVQIR